MVFNTARQSDWPVLSLSRSDKAAANSNEQAHDRAPSLNFGCVSRSLPF